MSMTKVRQLRPGYSSNSEEFLERSRKFIETSRKIREDAEKTLRAEREELYNSVWFDRNYWIPLEKFEDFMTNPDFDIEYYSFENYDKRYKRKQEISNYGYGIYNTYIDNFMENSGGMFYKQVVFLDNYTNRRMIDDVLSKMKIEFGEEYFDPFTEDDYNYGVDNFKLYDDEMVNEEDYELDMYDQHYIEDEA